MHSYEHSESSGASEIVVKTAGRIKTKDRKTKELHNPLIKLIQIVCLRKQNHFHVV
jgi:hypothetical protein